MKQVSLVILFISSFLIAKEPPSPYRSAEMEETDASGYVLQTFAYVKNTLTEMKRKDRTVSFEFTESMSPPPCSGPVCPMFPSYFKSTVFYKVQKLLSECGSTKFVGRSAESEMVLIDHSTRVCDDIQPHQWILKIRSGKNSVRYFRGNPTKIADTKCDRFAQQACVMLYAPATCYYEKTSAEGSNSCFAMAELKKMLCEKGVDADHIRDEDIACNMHMCALPMCAAPPEGCNYVPSNELNEDGCPKYPCGLLKCGQ